MSVVDIGEFLDYLSCPLKLFLGKGTEPLPLHSQQNLKSRIYSDLFDYSLLTRISSQSVTTTRLSNRLNLLWSQIKDSVSCPAGLSFKFSIKNKLDQISEYFESVDRVVYFNLPNRVQVLDTELLYFYSTYRFNDQLLTVVKISPTFLHLDHSSYPIALLGSLLHDQLKGDQQLRFFRTDTADLIEPPYKVDYLKHVEAVVKGIQDEIFYPRNDFVVCKSCRHAKVCDWSSAK